MYADSIADSESYLSAWNMFSDAAVKYKQVYNQTPILVIDNVDKLAPDQLDAWPRSEELVRVDDMSKEQTFQYHKLLGIGDDQIAPIYDLVGGRIGRLRDVVRDLNAGISFQEVRERLFEVAEGQLKKALILPRERYHKQGAAVIRELLKNGSVSGPHYAHLMGEAGDELLNMNAFSPFGGFRGGPVTFQSTEMQQYCEENASF
ncbi:hypothetical protein FGG08_001002 [Glutinoglossum americanum]|uniref:Uncharacterized protein n=1 Tax=Glutinoglossum americanum TaxID=1670608 RepID=A0A9P8I971_9PEZI|nr:hypothetical protein FGG08_001002 [Glutinoglossum americanum]